MSATKNWLITGDERTIAPDIFSDPKSDFQSYLIKGN